ncbi:hypothetical protein [Chryseobacterium bernardetii]|uniref:hypothetical protein n=1 Tax=Chryseobacterium bernardetii TaxID=1241978 RepID=UPI0013DDEA5F|nr:hypothetical protein [Chryseobacterium bernardetii]
MNKLLLIWDFGEENTDSLTLGSQKVLTKMENIFVRRGISFSQDYYYFDSLLSETPLRP